MCLGLFSQFARARALSTRRAHLTEIKFSRAKTRARGGFCFPLLAFRFFFELFALAGSEAWRLSKEETEGRPSAARCANVAFESDGPSALDAARPRVVPMSFFGARARGVYVKVRTALVKNERERSRRTF